MPNDITPHLSLPLPHPDNLLENDVERLREAFVLLDGSAAETAVALAAQQAALERQDTALSQVAEVVDEASAGVRAEAAARQTADARHDTALTALRQQLDALSAQVADIKVDPWDVFPPRVPIAVDGVRFGGSDGRRAILPGEAQARENWILCDGDSDGQGGTVPDLRDRVILGASANRPAGSVGGSETHSHSVSGTVGAATMSEELMPSHTHYGGNYHVGVVSQAFTNVGLQSGGSVIWNYAHYTGGNAAHAHSLATSSGAAGNLPPHHALSYIMRCA